MANIKRLIWIYFWLLLFEGALRKWLVPSLDTVLLLVRDPIVVVIYLLAMQRGVFPRNGFIMVGVLLAFLCVVFTIFAECPVVVGVFGMRVNFLHVPLVFVIGRVFDRSDVIKIGRWLLLISVPMAALIVYQFRSPQDAWINKGAFNTHYDTVRPSATFPFVTGTAIFLAFVAAFLAYSFIQKGRYPLWLRMAALPAVMGSMAVSGSRLAVMSVAVVVAAAVGATVVRGKGVGGVLAACLAIGAAFLVLQHTSFYKEGQGQLDQRFVDANPDQTNQTAFVTSRLTGDAGAAFEIMERTPLFGNGSGLGTSVGAQLTMGQRVFLGAEGEWGRLIWESGALLGGALILFRCWLAGIVGWKSLQALLAGEFLPILLLSSCIVNLIQGQWGVTNVQGFACFQAGLALAACRSPKVSSKTTIAEPLPAVTT
ncbi:MAG TPA: hypothetical protein VIM61_08165 [Chthoniobacterales bacterium]|jgi:hypothetical protein